MKKLRPHVNCYGYKSEEDTIVFLGETESIHVRGNTNEILVLLQKCTGHSSIEEISDSLQSEIDGTLIQKIFVRLFRIGVLVDSRNLYNSFH